MEKQEKISMFDPTANAYREIPIELAKKFIESAKEVEEKIKEKEKDGK